MQINKCKKVESCNVVSFSYEITCDINDELSIYVSASKKTHTEKHAYWLTDEPRTGIIRRL